ncbi:Maf family protein [Methylocella silvestris BL2]|uniref:Nucleoside triphosphate pyrophosphatase n=1 Tax=Methylocella silvestris (strain DSM 15510 / CIP 108128 / LMG 27833 / NCIMB 13906 / BL2) TaxID=395965 RepID=B8EM71_METSB|nr:Maf family protein [Methylocella silvestris]ACK51460.1 Maf family protein [Methylocella silvestris BL2]
MSGLWLGDAPLLLASKSASRAALLRAVGIPFEARDSALDERAVETPLLQGGAGAGEIAQTLAREKALAVAAREPGRLTLGADQTLACNGRLFTKAEDLAGAAAALNALSGQTHELHSALCLARDQKILFEASRIARMTMRALSPGFIAAYLDATGEGALGSVGAYQVEGLGMHLFERIEGDFSVIMGLPLLPLLAFLREAGLAAS